VRRCNIHMQYMVQYDSAYNRTIYSRASSPAPPHPHLLTRNLLTRISSPYISSHFLTLHLLTRAPPCSTTISN
jgi:hypothetical protein